jgi:glycyl-tRNA synthetase beta subunit
MLDKKAEASLLFVQEADLRRCMHNRLSQLLREEELKWYQRSKAKHLLEGDANTKYFQLLANGRHRKTRIFQLQNESHRITGDNDLKKYITSYYKNLLGPHEDSSMRIDERRRRTSPR